MLELYECLDIRPSACFMMFISSFIPFYCTCIHRVMIFFFICPWWHVVILLCFVTVCVNVCFIVSVCAPSWLQIQFPCLGKLKTWTLSKRRQRTQSLINLQQIIQKHFKSEDIPKRLDVLAKGQDVLPRRVRLSSKSSRVLIKRWWSHWKNEFLQLNIVQLQEFQSATWPNTKSHGTYGTHAYRASVSYFEGFISGLISYCL